MTHAEAEAAVRDIRRRCRGLPLLHQTQREGLHATFHAAFVARNWDMAMAVTQEAYGVIGKAAPSVDAGNWETLTRVAAMAIFAHGDTVGRPCGYDFNDTICANPFDGQSRRYTCPRCGQEGTYTAPVFEVTE